MENHWWYYGEVEEGATIWYYKRGEIRYWRVDKVRPKPEDVGHRYLSNALLVKKL